MKVRTDVDEPGISDRERLLRRGRADADVGAKHAIHLHSGALSGLESVDEIVNVARAWGVLVANMLPLWPKLSRGIQWLPKPPPPKVQRPPHHWPEWSGIWRWSHCLVGKRSIAEPLSLELARIGRGLITTCSRG